MNVAVDLYLVVDLDLDLVLDADEVAVVCVDETDAQAHLVQAHDYDSDYVYD